MTVPGINTTAAEALSTNVASGGMVSAPTAASIGQTETRVVEIAQILHDQEELRLLLIEMQQRVMALREQVRAARASARDAESLREEIRALRALLAQARGEAGADAGAGEGDNEDEAENGAEETTSGAALVDAGDGTGVGGSATDDDRVLAELLAQETAEQQEEIGRLREEVNDWLAQAYAFEEQLHEERRQREELEDLAEASMAEAEILRKQLHEVHAALATEQERSQALQAHLAECIPAPPPAAPAAAINLDPVMALLRDIAATVRRAADPSPVVVASLRDLREGISELTTAHRDLTHAVEVGLPITKPQTPAGPRADAPDTAQSGTTPALRPLLEQKDAEERGASREGTWKDGAEAVVSGGVDGRANVDHQADTAQQGLPANTSPSGEADAGDETCWEEAYPSIEAAWLAGRRVGDMHERAHFLSIVQMLQRIPRYRDETVLLEGLAAVRARYGEGFEYCLLERVLKRMHSLSLNPPLLAVQMGNEKGHRRRH